mmetsp:Transcript_25541/g.59468  ORF Transcript_25541/g.59468 Transcript_25541/m.59468 type:complete len:176 (-) Transcript_25541:113-640(-)
MFAPRMRAEPARFRRSALAVAALSLAVVFVCNLSSGNGAGSPPAPMAVPRGAVGDEATEFEISLLSDADLSPETGAAFVSAGAVSTPGSETALAGSSANRALLSHRNSRDVEGLVERNMKYKMSIKPRCSDCRIIVRFGRLWRVCKVRRHNARQPGIQGKLGKRMARMTRGPNDR